MSENPLAPIATDGRQVLRGDRGRLLPGTAAINPAGHPRGGGRVRALQAIDDLLCNAENQAKLRAALQADFDRNPVSFVRRMVFPLLPKTVQLDLQTGAALGASVSAVRIALGMDRLEVVQNAS